ncbi:MAG: hypothetical protein ACRDN0_28825 [Trebonia sp.]
MLLSAPLAELIEGFVGHLFVTLMQRGPIAPGFVELMRFNPHMRIVPATAAREILGDRGAQAEFLGEGPEVMRPQIIPQILGAAGAGTVLAKDRGLQTALYAVELQESRG